MKNFASVLSCMFVIGGYAGVRISGPVKLIDADGERCYEYLEAHDIVGEVGCIEIIGGKAGERESRGYLTLASPRWVVSSTDVVSHLHSLLKCDQYSLNHRHGVNLSLLTLSETNRLFVVAQDRTRCHKVKFLDGLRADSLYSRMMVDAATGFKYVGSCCRKFDDDSGDAILASFYVDGKGMVKVWYEVVDSSNAELSKGWVSGRVEGDRFVDRREFSIYGDKDTEILLMSREVKSKPAACKDLAWLHVAVKRNNAYTSVGIMLKRE